MQAPAPTTPAEPSGSAGRRPRRSRPLEVAAFLTLGPITAFVVLAVLGPAVLPYRTYVVRSGSMEPSLSVGDLAVYRPVGADRLGVGDVIAFTRPGDGGDVVTHRIERIEDTAGGERAFVTRGDANAEADAWRIPAQGEGWRYAFAVPKVGTALTVLGSGEARRAALVVGVLAAAIWALVRIWRPRPQAAAPPVAAPAPVDPETIRLAWPESEAARLALADCVSVVLGHAEILDRSLPADDPRRGDVEAIREAAGRAAAALPALVTARSGTPRSEPSAASAPRRRPLRPSGGRAARAR